jgi:hypothetical protein
VRVSKAGFEPALSMARSIRNLHHQRRFSRARRQTGFENKFLRGALNGAATANPLGFALPSVSGLRLVPSDRPRASRHAPAGASPGIRVSRSGLRRDVSMSLLRTTKNPPERVAQEGPNRADCRSRLREIAPMSRACVIEWPIAIRSSDARFVTVVHHTAHVQSRTRCSRRAREIRL